MDGAEGERMIRMAQLKQLNETDFLEWHFDLEIEAGLSNEIAKAVKEAIDNTIKDSPPYAYFPIEWDFGDSPGDGRGGPPVDDALTIDVTMPVADDNGVTFRFSMNGLIDDFSEGSGRAQGGMIIEYHWRATDKLI